MRLRPCSTRTRPRVIVPVTVFSFGGDFAMRLRPFRCPVQGGHLQPPRCFAHPWLVVVTAGSLTPVPVHRRKSSVSLRPRGDGRPDGNRRPWRVHSARRDDVRPRPPRTPTRGKRDSDEDSPPSRFRAGDRARRNRPPHQVTPMSHHFDSPTAIADGRINLCDFYVFPAAPGTTALILTVNPDAGRSS